MGTFPGLVQRIVSFRIPRVREGRIPILDARLIETRIPRVREGRQVRHEERRRDKADYKKGGPRAAFR